MFEKFKRKIKGREIEFGAYVAEAIVMDQQIEDIEFDIAKDRLDKYSKEQLLEKLKYLNKMITNAYTCLHSWNKTCHGDHKEWQDYSIKQYKAFVKAGIIGDRFGIKSDNISINIDEYKNIKIYKPIDKIDLKYSLYYDKELYSTNPKEHADLQLIQSYNNPNKFYVLHNEKGDIGDIVTIEENKLLSKTAKNKLLEEDKNEKNI